MPPLRDRPQERRRTRAVHNLLMPTIATATSGISPAKNRTLKGGGNRNRDSAGGKTGSVGFHRLHMLDAADSECVRGRHQVTRALVESHSVRARHQPRSFYGALRGAVPQKG
jgi:hypothetical protein